MLDTTAKIYQAFYTKSTPIVDCMIKSLMLKATDTIFEPCGGDGVFIDAITEFNPDAKIDVCELNLSAVELLKTKFISYPNIKIREADTLLDKELNLLSKFGGVYDKIIANPPYGAWQEYDKRNKLKSLYPNMYAKESYGLFLYRCIELLKVGGILSFIIPDTYLNIHVQKKLREYILTKTKILDLVLFPSSFFPGVNFGYANLSIITLQKADKEEEALSHRFKIITGFNKVDDLLNLNDKNLNKYSYTQQDIVSNPDHAFLISNNKKVITLLKQSKKIGDIADCVTGFYSGDDKTFLKASHTKLKNSKNYELIDDGKIKHDYQFINESDLLSGLDGNKIFVPIVKGGNTRYLKSDSWFMTWSKGAVAHYKSDKKARYQNPQYYFKFGIGVPMISSSSITASLIENKLFDQSIVGIFPKEKSLTYYLLAFFNSPTCNTLIRTINPSANNPANYIKKIPFIAPSATQKAIIDDKVSTLIDNLKAKNSYSFHLEDDLNEIIKSIYGF